MKASFEWIKELLPEFKGAPKAVRRRLDQIGVAVDGVSRPGDVVSGVIVGEVKTCEPHPKSDRLKVTTVFDGSETHQVVCGAANVAAGQRVPFAPVGVTLSNGMHIEARAIRGVESKGMICAADELGLALSSDGIMVLKPRSKPGRPVADVLKLNDTVFELDLTPNRADLLSHFGLARELAAVFEVAPPRLSASVKEIKAPASKSVQVRVLDKVRCPLYAARVIRGVKVGPSPQWVQQRLLALGQRPVSNVVDATNLALLELGHPLHAFDLDKVTEAKIEVRVGRGESLRLIDGSSKKVTEDDLVIADGSGPIALAGVMGGTESEVGDDTTDILLESAFFDAVSVRRTSRAHGIHSEASHRFERGVDPEMVLPALDHCAGLIVELAGGVVERGRVTAGKAPSSDLLVPIRPARTEMVMGRPVERSAVRSILKRLGLKSVPTTKVPKRVAGSLEGALWFKVPSWRVDLTLEVDLIEEIARIVGYDAIPQHLPDGGRAVKTAVHRPRLADAVRRAMVGQGLLEALSLGFSSDRDFEALGASPGGRVELANPLGEETAFMRFSLIPALLHAVRRNQDQLPSLTNVRLFELGKTFRWGPKEQPLPTETKRIAVVLRGARAQPSWTAAKGAVDVFDLKGLIEVALERSGVTGVQYDRDEVPWLHPRTAGRMRIGPMEVGRFGELHPDVADAFGLEGPPVFVAELELDALEAGRHGPPQLAAVSPHPPAQRDLSFFVSKSAPASQILATVEGAASGEHLESVELFDVYDGPNAPEGQRSLAIALTFRAPDRTLKDEEVERAQERVVQALAERHGAQLRSA